MAKLSHINFKKAKTLSYLIQVVRKKVLVLPFSEYMYQFKCKIVFFFFFVWPGSHYAAAVIYLSDCYNLEHMLYSDISLMPFLVTFEREILEGVFSPEDYLLAEFRMADRIKKLNLTLQEKLLFMGITVFTPGKSYR